MMSQEEILPWTEPDTNFFADNLLGIEDWGDSITDITLGQNDVLLGDNDQEMDVNTDDLSELLENIGDDMWAISEDTVKTLGPYVKQEPPSPSSSTSSLVSYDSSLPSSPESQLLTNGQYSPIHNPSYTKIEPAPLRQAQPIKTEQKPPLICIRTEPNLTLPLTGKSTSSVTKTEVTVTPSCMIKQEPITIQPCSLVKPLPSLPAGQVHKITIQNGQQAKLLQQRKGVAVSTAGNITYIPVSGTLPANTILVGNKTALPISNLTSPVVSSSVTTANSPLANSSINDKVMKRQQRMIKNRESACLSRKKKKEYLQSLETKIKEVTQVNDRLNQENMKLKFRITELEKENISLKSNHPNWSTTKKSTCVLAVVLLVAFNIGSFSSLQNPWKFNSQENLLSVHHGRALLQYEDTKSNDNSRPLVYGPLRKAISSNTDTLGSPLRDTIIKLNSQRKDLIVVKNKWDFLSDINKKKPSLLKKQRRRKYSMRRMNALRNNTKNVTASVCPSLQVNATESLRLNEVLGNWIHTFQEERSSRRKKPATTNRRKPKTVKELALRLTPNCTETQARKKMQRHMFLRRHNSDASTNKNAVQLFRGVDWLKMFSEAINRQDDTMYIVSFRQDHLVFPASKSNATQRPKVSLMLMAPSNDTTVNVTNGEESISMIQIDCQVMDTKHINIKKSSLPKPFADSFKYRPTKTGYSPSPSEKTSYIHTNT